MEGRKRVQIDFSNTTSRTKQEFKEECNINNLVNRWLKAGAPPLPETGEIYGDFTNVGDFMQAVTAVQAVEDIFASLPSAIRAASDNSPAKLIEMLDENPELDLENLGSAVGQEDGQEPAGEGEDSPEGEPEGQAPEEEPEGQPT